jgi:hypothetical protein
VWVLGEKITCAGELFFSQLSLPGRKELQHTLAPLVTISFAISTDAKKIFQTMKIQKKAAIERKRKTLRPIV